MAASGVCHRADIRPATKTGAGSGTRPRSTARRTPTPSSPRSGPSSGAGPGETHGTEGSRSLTTPRSGWPLTRRKPRPTRARDEMVIRRHLLPVLGRMPLAEITARDVQAVINRMAAELAPKTVLTNAGVLRAVLNSAVLEDRIYASPYRRPKLPAPAARGDRRRLTMAMSSGGSPMPSRTRTGRWSSLPASLGCGFRKWWGCGYAYIDFLARPPVLRVQQPLPEVSGRHVVSRGKTPASRTALTLPDFLVDMLAGHLARYDRRSPEDFVFQLSWVGRCMPATSGPGMGAGGPAAGFDGLTFHALRHSATGLMRARSGPTTRSSSGGCVTPTGRRPPTSTGGYPTRQTSRSFPRWIGCTGPMGNAGRRVDRWGKPDQERRAMTPGDLAARGVIEAIGWPVCVVGACPRGGRR